jgi:tetrahydromethanopterin S-methyltransferase subunit G
MEKPITTIEDLAAMIHRTMASKEDVQTLGKKVTDGFERVDSRLNHLDARVGRIEADVHALRDEMVHRDEFEDALARLKYIEKKLGIESGV